MIIQLYASMRKRLFWRQVNTRLGRFLLWKTCKIRHINTGCTDDGSFYNSTIHMTDIHNTVLCRNHRSKNDSILSSSLITAGHCEYVFMEIEMNFYDAPQDFSATISGLLRRRFACHHFQYFHYRLHRGRLRVASPSSSSGRVNHGHLFVAQGYLHPRGFWASLNHTNLLSP